MEDSAVIGGAAILLMVLMLMGLALCRACGVGNDPAPRQAAGLQEQQQQGGGRR